MPVTVAEVQDLARTFPRSSEAFVRGRLKFRIGQIVFLAFSKDGSTMGFGFPKEWRAALGESGPDKFSLPRESGRRVNWGPGRPAAIDGGGMRAPAEKALAGCVAKVPPGGAPA